jgi:hypothetical protein
MKGWVRALPITAAVILAVPAEAQQATLALACEGTRSSGFDKKEDNVSCLFCGTDPISMGVVIDFNTRTVQGFGRGYSVEIRSADDALIDFAGDDGGRPPLAREVISGTIDRVSGKLEADASTRMWDEKASIYRTDTFRTTYKLECKPAQRLF